MTRFLFIIFFIFSITANGEVLDELGSTQVDSFTLREVELPQRLIECRSADGKTVVTASTRGAVIESIMESNDFDRDGTIDEYNEMSPTNPRFAFQFEGQQVQGYPWVMESVRNQILVNDGPSLVYELNFYEGANARDPSYNPVIAGHPPIALRTPEFIESQREAFARVQTLQEDVSNNDFILTIERRDKSQTILTTEANNNSYSNFTYLRCVRVSEI